MTKKTNELLEDVRVSFIIPRELHEKVTRTIPWGARTHFFNKLLELGMHRVEKGGYEVLGAIVSGDYDLLGGGNDKEGK